MLYHMPFFIIFYLFYLWVFSEDSLFNSNELLSMRVLPCETLQRSLVFAVIFATEGLTGDRTRDLSILNSTSLTIRPRIHSWIVCGRSNIESTWINKKHSAIQNARRLWVEIRSLLVYLQTSNTVSGADAVVRKNWIFPNIWRVRIFSLPASLNSPNTFFLTRLAIHWPFTHQVSKKEDEADEQPILVPVRGTSSIDYFSTSVFRKY